MSKKTQRPEEYYTMDSRRLSTADVLMAGIIGRAAPVTDIPEERERFSGSGDMGDYVGDEAVREAVEAGKLVSASNYYGIPYLWKQGDGYLGRLLQYRAVTESPAFATIEEALEWFAETYRNTDG